MVITFRKDLVRDVGDQIFKWLLLYKMGVLCKNTY